VYEPCGDSFDFDLGAVEVCVVVTDMGAVKVCVVITDVGAVKVCVVVTNDVLFGAHIRSLSILAEAKSSKSRL
jgi:hypothetical protein